MLGKVLCLNLKLSSACGAVEAALLQSINSISSAGVVVITPTNGVWRTSRNPNHGWGWPPPASTCRSLGGCPSCEQGWADSQPSARLPKAWCHVGGAGQVQHTERGDTIQTSGRWFRIHSLDLLSQDAHENYCLKIL